VKEAFSVAAAFAAALLTSCGTMPSADDVAKLGAATANAVSVIGETGKLEDDLSVAFATDMNACKYLQSSTYLTGPPRADRTVTRLKDQAAFLSALSDCAQAISKATDPNAIAKLKAAAAQVTTSATEILTAAAVLAPGAAAVAHVVKISVDSAVFFSEQERIRQIHQIAKSLQPYLLDATVLTLTRTSRIESCSTSG
jgi:hypothetical protein